jgi:TctA family transporter
VGAAAEGAVSLLYPMILVFCCIGVYTVNNTTFDVWIIAVFGVIGYIFAKLECEAPRCCSASSWAR